MHDFIEQICGKIEEANQRTDSGTYIALINLLAQAKNHCRENIQALTQESIHQIIKKLKKNEPLSAQDLDLVKLWIVGDAILYTHAENNVEIWKTKVAKLATEIKSHESEATGIQSLTRLAALITELDRTLQDMTAYLQNKERVERFEINTKHISPEEKETLIEILGRKLNSQDA